MDISNPSIEGRKNWHNFVDLVLQKAWAGLRVEAARGYLGVLWWVLEPIMYMSVFYTLFVHVLHRGNQSFITFLLVGLIPWKWFASTINAGSKSLLGSVGIMNQVYLPKIVFPLTTVAINTYKFLIILALLLVFLQFTSAKISLVWIALPLVFLTQLLLIVSVTSFLAAIMPFFPDLRIILDNLLMMLFFLSGIFFDINKLSESVQGVIWLNPMATMIATYRTVLLDGSLPDWRKLLFVILFSFAILTFALWLFRRFDRVYPKIIH